MKRILCVSIGALALHACSTSTQVEEAREKVVCENPGPQGTHEMVTKTGTSIQGVSVGQIESCGDSREGYIELSPTSGVRSLVLGRDENGRIAGCQRPPRDESDCPEILADALFKEVYAELEDEGISVMGYGRGVCGKSGDYASFDASLFVNDWANVDAAVSMLARKMHEWNIENTAGISVRARDCKINLQSK